MVVILLLTPYSANGCDGGSEGSNTRSTASTGATAISTKAYQAYQHEYQQKKPQFHIKNQASQANVPKSFTPDSSQSFITHLPIPHNTKVQCDEHNQLKPHGNYFVNIPCNKTQRNKSQYAGSFKFCRRLSPSSPTPPPLPKSKPPYELLYQSGHATRFNAVPKPPRGNQQSNQRKHYTTPGSCFDPALNEMCQSPCLLQRSENKENIENSCVVGQHQTFKSLPHKITNIEDIVRHVTRVNFYDVDTLQVEFEPKDDENCDTEAITKEEEWITKKKTELTTTRQIETRVKRQVVLADGKVVEDSGPIVSTNTTEDTDKQETETTEKRDLGIPDDQVNVTAITQDAVDGNPAAQLVAVMPSTVSKLLARPADGLVRETNEKRIISHEEVKDYLETEDVRHLGDFSDEIYINAINNRTENLEATLFQAAHQNHFVTTAPKVIATTNKSYKTIDTEDSLKRCFAQSDGTIKTENKKTTEHEVIVEGDLPKKDDGSTGSQEKITTVEAHQRYFKQRDEQNVDTLANGKVIGTEMRYAAETMQVEKDGSLERPGDWDSLSDRMRKLRKPQKSLLQQQKEAALLLDRKDALTKRPLDFDREEETRKGETMKWLESHFGSESTASNESRDDTEVEPTKRTFFNVTIKSNHGNNDPPLAVQRLVPKVIPDKGYHKEVEPQLIAGKTKFYQGVSNWNDRKNITTHFATKEFQDDLRETVERNRLKKSLMTRSREKLYNGLQHASDSNDNYVSREDILQQKRQSLSSQFLARSKRGSVDINSPKDQQHYNIGSLTDIKFFQNEDQKKHQDNLHVKSELHMRDVRDPTGRKIDYEAGRVRKSLKENENFENMTTPRRTYDVHMYEKDMKNLENDHYDMQSKTLDRPAVPQRKRAVERRLRQQISAPSETISPFQAGRVEPPPDYSPPPRSRSASPQIDYILTPESKNVHAIATDSPNFTANIVSARKLNQRTRFAPSSLTPHSSQAHHHVRPKMSTQTTQTTPSTISSSTAPSHKSNKMGQAIGNSIRKLVNKIRSASAERKFRMKSKSKSREQSPTFQGADKVGTNSQSTTYQQYNLIDSHIGSQSNGHESEQDCANQPINSRNNSIKMEPIELANSEKNRTLRRTDSTDLYTSQRDLDTMTNPRQRYYLGEDPYSSTLYGKENIFNSGPPRKQNRDIDVNLLGRNSKENDEKHNERLKDQHRYMSSNTLGRYQKSSQRLVGSTPNLPTSNRMAKTLPRKLADHPENSYECYKGSKIEGKAKQHITTINTGPVKPARTYSKILSRSKSFNLHGLNGTTENSPIYIEKFGGKEKTYTNSHFHTMYKRDTTPKESTLLQSGLKSPSIVNLISRSQKDLTKIGSQEEEIDFSNFGDKAAHSYSSSLQRESNEKKNIFLKNLHQQAPDLYRTLHADEEFRNEEMHKYPLKAVYSLDSRTPIKINTDTASLVRGEHTKPENTSLARREKYHLYMDDKRRGSGSTIVAVNRK